MVTVNDLETGKKPKEFSFDHAFWSFDEFTIDENGYNTPTASNKYTDQRKVWNLLGTSVLEKAWKGLNNTIFAYGQTSSGKTHTMQGVIHDEELQGIIPRIVKDIFDRKDAMEEDENLKFTITASYLEIYLEKISDLLSGYFSSHQK